MADSDAISKPCSVCMEDKPLDCFHRQKTGKYGRASKCKPCAAAYQKAHKEKRKKEDPDGFARRAREHNQRYAQKHAERKRRKYAEWRSENKEHLKAKKKEWRQKNLARLTEQGYARYWENPSFYRERQKKYADRTGAHQKQAARRKVRAESDPVYAMKARVRTLILTKLRMRGFTKRSKTYSILGCDWAFFKTHIERQFLPNMTWENRDKWHLDHIVPISTAKTVEDVERLNHHTNLRPMWAEDNLHKGGKRLTLL